MKMKQKLFFFCFLSLVLLCITTTSFWRLNLIQQQLNKQKCDEGQFLSKTQTTSNQSTRQNVNIEFLKEPDIYSQVLRRKNENDTCNVTQKLVWNMVIFVKSAAANRDHRQLIRQTWGSIKLIEGRRFFIVFVVGVNTKSQLAINHEHEDFYDILQISQLDDYRYIGVKTLASMKWASENLPYNFFYSTSDDDMWIDMLKLVGVITEYNNVVGERNWPEFPVICTYKFGEASVKPIRKPKDKNFIPREKYRWPYWPAFCFGGMYTTSVSTAKQLWEISQISEPFLNVDDVWITGLLRHKLGMPDEMIIKLDEPLAQHYKGFKNKEAKKLLEFKEWNDLSKRLEKISVCHF